MLKKKKKKEKEKNATFKKLQKLFTETGGRDLTTLYMKPNILMLATVFEKLIQKSCY